MFRKRPADTKSAGNATAHRRSPSRRPSAERRAELKEMFGKNWEERRNRFADLAKQAVDDDQALRELLRTLFVEMPRSDELFLQVLRHSFLNPAGANHECYAVVRDARASRILVSLLSEYDHDPSLEDELVAIGDMAVPALLGGLQDQRPNVRSKVVEILGKIGDSRSVAPLLELLSDNEIRWSVAEALSRMAEGAVEPLLERLDTEQRSAVRIELVRLLGESRKATAILPLLGVLDTPDQPSDVRVAAASALGQIGHADAVPGLVAATQDGDDAVVAEAARSLGRIGDKRAVDALVATLSRSDPTVRQMAARALGAVSHEGAADPLLRALNDPAPAVCAESALALCKLANHHCMNLLVSALQRSGEALADGRLGDILARDRLVAVVRDHSEVRAALARGIAQAQDRRFLDALFALWADREPGVRASAVSAMGSIDDEQVIWPLVLSLCEIDQPEVMRAAEAALTACGVRDPRVLRFAVAGLGYHSEEFCQAIGDSVERMGDAAVGPLVEVFRGPISPEGKAWDVRARILEWLCRLGNQAVSTLLAALDGSEPFPVRSKYEGEYRTQDWRTIVDSLAGLGWKPTHSIDWAVWWIARDRVRRAARQGASAVGPLVACLRDINWFDGGIPRLLPLLHWRIGWYRGKRRLKDAYAALGSLGAPAARALMKVATDEWRSDWTRLQAARALGPLVRHLDAEQLAQLPHDSAVALGTLSLSEEVESLLALEAALRHEDPAVRGTAVTALKRRRWRPPDAAAAAWYATASGDWGWWLEAREPRLAVLAGALRWNSAEVRRTAAYTLDQLGWSPVDPAEAAVVAMARGDWSACLQAGSAAVAPLADAVRLIRAASGEDRQDQLPRAKEVLRQLAARDPMPLFRLLDDPRWEMQALAVETLVLVDAAAAVEPLAGWMLRVSRLDENLLLARRIAESAERHEWLDSPHKRALDRIVRDRRLRDERRTGRAQTEAERSEPAGSPFWRELADFLSRGGWVPQSDEERAVLLAARGLWKDCAELGQAASVPLLFHLVTQPKATRADVAEVVGNLGDRDMQLLSRLLRNRALDVETHLAEALFGWRAPLSALPDEVLRQLWGASVKAGETRSSRGSS